ncbi:hypothetical protein CALVIDRAFT_551699 [Calocera viscosa TUFC12733]|uniref:Uncharacterized protein n=1 Tax=Calocera viscosa (strain TUFC12733) TaxID=1330018 RepID=A0A167FZB6_CALVF|nr:hypothetical protein CALVIDRAFT_551699 [Calocera viscosa TUFC12733]
MVALLVERAVVHAADTLQDISDVSFDVTWLPPTSSNTVTLRIYRMTCSACASTTERELLALPGVTSCAVSLASPRANPRNIVARVEELEFDAMLSIEDDAMQLRSLTGTKEVQERRQQFWRIPMVCPMVPFFAPIVKFQLLRGIFLVVRHGRATMVVLVMLGTSAAFVYSVMAMLAALFISTAAYHRAMLLETSNTLITFVFLGRYLEDMAKGKMSAALTDIMALAPSMATIYTDAECTKEKRVSTELVQVGDIVPVYGTVVRGSSSVDESTVTGEPVPVKRLQGPSVIGDIVNDLGAFDMIVVKLVKEAQTNKTPHPGVHVVITPAVLTFSAWMIVSHMVDVAKFPHVFHMRAATGVGTKNGIIMKGGWPLEARRHIKKVLFDKTGTITQGKPSVANFEKIETPQPDAESLAAVSADGITSKALVHGMVSAAETKSKPSPALGDPTYAKRTLTTSGINGPNITLDSFDAQVSIDGFFLGTNSGSSGKHPITVHVGSSRFVSRDASFVPFALSAFEASQSALGRPSRASPAKPSPAPAIRALQTMGIDANIMRGDSETTANAPAKEIGLRPEAVPSRVGDSINDSPALVAAARYCNLLRHLDLLDFVTALTLSHAIFSVISVIRRNLVWACVYNVFGIPLAMCLFLPLLSPRPWRKPASSIIPGEPVPKEGCPEETRMGSVLEVLRETFRFSEKKGYEAVPLELGATPTTANTAHTFA